MVNNLIAFTYGFYLRVLFRVVFVLFLLRVLKTVCGSRKVTSRGNSLKAFILKLRAAFSVCLSVSLSCRVAPE